MKKLLTYTILVVSLLNVSCSKENEVRLNGYYSQHFINMYLYDISSVYITETAKPDYDWFGTGFLLGYDSTYIYEN